MRQHLPLTSNYQSRRRLSPIHLIYSVLYNFTNQIVGILNPDDAAATLKNPELNDDSEDSFSTASIASEGYSNSISSSDPEEDFAVSDDGGEVDDDEDKEETNEESSSANGSGNQPDADDEDPTFLRAPMKKPDISFDEIRDSSIASVLPDF